MAKGGAERATAILSQMLASQGMDVHLVTLTNAIDYEYTGSLFNLGEEKEKDNSFFGKIKRFIAFKRYLKQEKFDYIIDNRNRQFAVKEWWYLNYIYANQKLIYVVHSSLIEHYFTYNTYVGKQICKKAHEVVGVSKSIVAQFQKKYQTSKGVTIYNSVNNLTSEETYKKPADQYILFLGRMVENVKNFSLLLEGYKQSQIASKGVQLVLLGEGPDSSFLKEQVSLLELENNVLFLPFTPHVKDYIKDALFLTLTSYYEGFPMVLIEALSQGTPVVAVDCNSGPAEIIQHQHNGLLVENHNVTALAEAYKKMVTDKKLLVHCKANAMNSVAHLTFETIAKQWATVLEK